MKAARIVVLGVAVAAGGIAALLASSGHQPEPPNTPPVAPVAPLATVDVLVAKTDLGRGQMIDARDVGWQAWPTAAANASFIKKTERPDAINQFAGAIVRVPVAAGEPIRDPAVVFAKGSGFLAAILPKGMRAVSMEIAPENGAGGFILPEDHVDIVLTRHDRAAEKANNGVEKIVSETILRNVRVLAVDQAVEEKSGQKVAVGRTATVELTPEQAETLALSRQLGTLSLALRSLLDSQSSSPENGGEHNEETRTSINTVRYGVSTLTTAR
ncbi:MAG: Flp pilus assembly protein CpaB [Xanthobacteraceae bacterium]|jgi:pilus assembly protein CpaB